MKESMKQILDGYGWCIFKTLQKYYSDIQLKDINFTGCMNDRDCTKSREIYDIATIKRIRASIAEELNELFINEDMCQFNRTHDSTVADCIERIHKSK